MRILNKLSVCASVVMITTVAFFVVISPRASAGTPVGGYIDSDTAWGIEGSPYWVEKDVIVRNGSNLTIEVGVDVLFNGYYSIYVEEGGVLWVERTAPHRPYALFSWNLDYGGPYPGRWRSIQFNDSSYDTSSIEESVIEYAYYGIRLESASPTIKNSTIRSCTYGIYSNYGCPNIENNIIEKCIEDGIYIEGIDPGGGYANLENNTVQENTKHGIVLYDVSGVRFRNNNIAGSNYNFGVWADTLSEFNHDIDTTNTVNQQPIYYWRNHEHDGETIPSDAGYVGIVNSAYITVENLTLTHNGQGVLVAYSDYTSIDNVTASDNELGIILFSSSNNIIENSIISNNDYLGYYYPYIGSGIYLRSSSNNNIINSTVYSNNLNGIYLLFSNDNKLLNNTIMDNSYGAYLENSSYNLVDNNNVSDNSIDGIYLDGTEGSHYNIISNNTVNSNTHNGIKLWLSKNSEIKNNSLVENQCGIYLLGGTNNVISTNTLTSNQNKGIHLQSNYNDVNNNTISYSEYGIYVRGNNNNISFNSISNCDTGIYIWMTYQYNIVNNNNVSYNVYGITVEGGLANTIKDNIYNHGSILDKN